MNAIVYAQENGVAAVVWPATDNLSTEELLSVGHKDIPQGAPFWIVPADSIPVDRTFRDAWELDPASLGEPAGFGGAA
jgi:hypothetical protein